MARKKYSASFKGEIALDAIKSDMTISELASKHNGKVALLAIEKVFIDIAILIITQ